VRDAATDYLRKDQWADFLALEPALRDDREYWVSFWAAACHRRAPGRLSRLACPGSMRPARRDWRPGCLSYRLTPGRRRNCCSAG
jgi:hypothetical protein